MFGDVRRNGILAAPRTMVAYVLPFVLGATALGMRDSIPSISRQFPKTAKALRADITRFEGYKLRKGFVRPPQYSGQVPGYKARIQVDLSDLGPTYPWREMQRLNPEIDLYILLNSPARPGELASFGMWDGQRRINSLTLQVHNLVRVLQKKVFDLSAGPADSGYEEFKAQVSSTLGHELRHFMQVALAEGIKGRKLTSVKEVLEAETLGLDKLKGPENRVQPPRSEYEKYLLQDVEFYPWLGEALSNAIRWAELRAQSGRKLTASEFLEYQKDSGFIRALSRDPAKYRRVRQEITAAIENWRERKAAQAAWQRYSTGPRVITTLLDRLDREDPDLAAKLRRHRRWAEDRAKEELYAYRAKGEAIRASAAAK